MRSELDYDIIKRRAQDLGIKIWLPFLNLFGHIRSELDHDIIKRRAQDLGIRWTLIYPLLLSALFFLSYFFFHLYYILFLFFYFLMLFQKPLQMTRKGLIDPPLLLQGTIQKVG